MNKIILLTIMLAAPFLGAAAQVVSTPQKTTGYRIQLYSGCNGRASRIEAEKAASTCRLFYPELYVYCHYKQPRWVCRVGDFATQAGAEEYMKKLRATQQFFECHVVKSQINRFRLNDTVETPLDTISSYSNFEYPDTNY